MFTVGVNYIILIFKEIKMKYTVKEQAGGSADPGSATAPDPDLTPRQQEAQENP
jgi:hypothetical protein